MRKMRGKDQGTGQVPVPLNRLLPFLQAIILILLLVVVPHPSDVSAQSNNTRSLQ